VLFVLGLLSKSAIATLPVSLLVTLWWQRGRIEWKRDAVPILPLLALGLVSGLFTAWVERTFIGAAGDGFAFSLVARCLIAGRAVWFYLSKLFWPVDLAFIYPRWTYPFGKPRLPWR
jgi:protein O-mannosyl-transferase